jgi:hypothetical protein
MDKANRNITYEPIGDCVKTNARLAEFTVSTGEQVSGTGSIHRLRQSAGVEGAISSL